MKKLGIAVIVCMLAIACGDKGSKSKSNDANNGGNNANNGNNDGSDDNLKTVDGPVSEDRAKSVITDRVCEAYEICGCGEIAGVDLSNCRAGLGFSYDYLQEQARELGLTYDGECAERLINAMANRGCTVQAQNNPYCREENCQVYHGSKGVGEECDGGLSWSECAQGLICAGECQEPCRFGAMNLPEGSVCYDPDQGINNVCAEGLLCDTAGDGTCKALPTVGQPCLQNGLCAEGLWCNRFEGEPFICEPFLPEGSACTYPSECESLNCTEGSCGPRPGAGEPCGTQNCTDDLVCAFDGGNTAVCRTLPEEGEACLPNSVTPCAEGLACDGESCRPKPKQGESCGDQDAGIYLQCEEGSVCGTVLCRLQASAPGCAACAGDDDCTALVCQQIPPSVCGDSGYLLY